MKDITEVIDETNRMLLRALSDNNEFFLFEDRLKREFKLYTLMKSHYSKDGKITKCVQLGNIINHNCDY